MRKLTLFLTFCLLSNLAFSQGKVDKENIVIGKIDSVKSNILGEQRKIWVHVPDGAANSKERYPVVYVLDGDGHFSSVVGLIQQLSTGGNNNCPKMIVVAIPNTDRTRDLTPTHIDADPPFMDSTFSKTSGGGENFIAFIEKELMPHIEAKYPAAPYKMLIGHSFGGLAVMQTFTHHTQLFNAYICIDPSMWWDKENLLKQTQKALEEKKFEGKSLYLGIANTLEEGMDIKKVQKDTSADSRHIRSILKLQAAFEKNKQNGLKYRGKYYPDDTHGSVPFITEYDALRFFFDFFPLKFTMEDFTDSTGALADKYQDHFAQLSQKMGYTIKPDEGEINFIGYDFLGRKMYKTAARLFKLNVDNYPESYNVYDSYGDYFVAIKDTANAIIQFKKALDILENEGSRKKLEALEKADSPFWPRSSAAAEGLDPLVIDSIHQEIKAGKYGLIDHFLVIRHGKILADYQYKQDYKSIAQKYDTTNFQFNYDHPDWHPYYKGTDLHTLQSVSKSITSALLGIALEQHQIRDLDRKVMPFFKEYGITSTDWRKNDISLEDLLTMRSGIEWDESAYGETDDCIIMEKSDNWIPYVLNKPMDTIPGVVFEYNSGASVLLGKIVRTITGKRIDQWAEEVLFKPLGITRYYWKLTPEGEIDTEGGLYLSAQDLAKIGFLFLRKGKWEGKQIVPEAWVAASTSPVVAHVNPLDDKTMGYGYQWWVPKHSTGKSDIFAGNGYGGQFLMVVPQYDLIVVFNGWNIHDRPEKSSWRVLEERIIPGIRKG